ncbi:hypothetical protein WMY93_024484 [Mugilogobius chulae]|uniref:Reelin domain-containing protein n=1 Tax=Mugilogobius chulae TaxID=88201 RepID=A0AAW0N440_9GOBI
MDYGPMTDEYLGGTLKLDSLRTLLYLKMSVLSNLLWRFGFLSIMHQGNKPIDSQKEPLPFEVVPIKYGQDLVTVTLKSKDSRPFAGFMLEARTNTNQTVGKFLISDPSQFHLLNCSGVQGSAVSQATNNDKRMIEVNWTSEGGDVQGVIFRATFVQEYSTFWDPVDFNVSIPPPEPTATPGTTKTGTDTTAAVITTLKTTEFSTSMSKSTVPTSQSSSPPTIIGRNQTQVEKYTPQMASAALVLAFAVTAPYSFPNNAKCHCLQLGMRIFVCVSTVSLSISAFALVLVEDYLNSIEFGLALTMAVIGVISLGLLLFVYKKIGRSHELKYIFDIILVIVFLLQLTFAIAFIYQSTKQCQSWLLGVLIFYTVCVGLQIIYYLIIGKVLKVTDTKNRSVHYLSLLHFYLQLKVCTFVLITLPLFFTVAFCVVVIVGICQCYVSA